MEGPFFPRHPQQSFGSPFGQKDSTCRVEELARALRDSTVITPARFSWVTSDQLCSMLRSQTRLKLLPIDVRDAKESAGGMVVGSLQLDSAIQQVQLDNLVEMWRSGRHLVFYCTRSLTRAPVLAQQLLTRMENLGCVGVSCDEEPRVSVLEGGIVGLMQAVMRLYSQQTVELEPPKDLVSNFQPEKWIFCYSPDGPQVAHVSEMSENAEREVEELVEEEMCDELTFLVDQRMSLSPQVQGSMPYIS
mmetsp:Transcript_931/g.2057  ORF Transcript_931/g.2057 Transcript_931/m.2057 type:complete len:247 (-) Transcript_931:40-780(-)